MDRLNGVRVDKKWIIKEIDNQMDYTYKLIDEENSITLNFKEIIGIEQISNNEFLVYDRYDIQQYRIRRYKQEELELKKTFEVKFNEFYFITEERILFVDDNDFCLGIYSIQDNKYLEEGKWLNKKIVTTFSNPHNPKEIGLCVEEKLISYLLNHPVLIFTVDPKTLQPNSACYSQLRGEYVEVKDKKDIQRLEEEDRKIIRKMEYSRTQKGKEALQKVKKDLTRQGY